MNRTVQQAHGSGRGWRRALWLAMAAALCALISPALAQDMMHYKQQIQRHNQHITEFESADVDGVLGDVLKEARALISQVEAALIEEDYEIADALLRRVEARMAFAAAQFDWKQAQAEIEARNTEFETLRARHDELESELKVLQQREQLLKSQINTMQTP